MGKSDIILQVVAFIIMGWMGTCRALYAQQVSGTVTDAQTGKTLPGVNILVVGTSIGTATDVNGHYELQVESLKDTLRFPFIGYQTKTVPINGRTTVDIALKTTILSGQQLVVVGYGKKREADVTGAVSQIKGADIKETPSVSLSNSLGGRIPGLYIKQTSAIPGYDNPQILVRGFTTYRNSSALVVIDGVPQADPAGISRLDPHEIESISVLKDASAAIYGSRSSGGVILVTTKRGKKGKPVFNYSGSGGIQIPTMKPRSANALEYMHILNSRRKLDGTSLDFDKETIDKYKSGKLKSTDWWDALVDPPVPQTRHSLSVSGGSDSFKYYTAVGTVDQFGGLLRGDHKTRLNQYNLRANLDYNISQSLKASFNIALREKQDVAPQSDLGGAEPGGNLCGAVSTSPLIPAFINGNYDLPASGFSQENPAAEITSNGFDRRTNDVINLQFKGNYKIPGINGLSVSGMASIIKNTNREKNFNWLWHFYKKDQNGKIVRVESRNPANAQSLREDYSQNRRITANARVHYKTSVKEHNIDAFIEAEQMSYKTSNFWTARNFFITDKIPYLFAGTPDKDKWDNSGSAAQASRRSLFGRVSYNFSNKYLATFNFRYDGSYIFPKDSRWGFFPGLSVGWLISKEPFIPEIFSTLKIRASWGETGNDRVDPFQFLSSFTYSPATQGIVFNGESEQGLQATTTPNPNITWEVTKKTDIGLKIGLLQDKINFKIDLFRAFTDNILGKKHSTIPIYTGLILPDENIGKMRNHGFEFQMLYRNRFSNELTFNIGANISYNKNKIIHIGEVPNAEPYQKKKGHPFGASLVYKAI
jgi:TonB-linked SusC/RagA family outer membrane protein